MFSFTLVGVGRRIVSHYFAPQSLPAKEVYFLNFHSSERLKNWNIQRNQCEGRNSRRYVCFVLSFQTYQIHMSIPSAGSVAFLNKAEGIPCTKAKLWGDFPQLPDCNVTMASGNERVCFL
jgi:hypothetical protein